jgi:hypothetical protein
MHPINRFILYTHIFENLTNNLSEELGKNATTRNMGNNKMSQDTDNANLGAPFFTQTSHFTTDRHTLTPPEWRKRKRNRSILMRFASDTATVHMHMASSLDEALLPTAKNVATCLSQPHSNGIALLGQIVD